MYKEVKKMEKYLYLQLINEIRIYMGREYVQHGRILKQQQSSYNYFIFRQLNHLNYSERFTKCIEKREPLLKCCQNSAFHSELSHQDGSINAYVFLQRRDFYQIGKRTITSIIQSIFERSSFSIIQLQLSFLNFSEITITFRALR